MLGGALSEFAPAAFLISHTPDGEGMRVKADILGCAVDCYVGAPGAHIAQNVVGALAAVALLEGDVLNAAAALKNFAALKGRGARFDAGGMHVIDESYNANPASMRAALALLGQAENEILVVRRIQSQEWSREASAQEVADDVEDRTVKHDEALLDRLIADGLNQEALANSRRPEEEHVAGFPNEAGPLRS